MHQATPKSATFPLSSPTDFETKAAVPIALVVDDDSFHQRLCSDLLREEGYRVELAATGEAAISAMATQTYDLVVCDIAMPHPDVAKVVGAARATQGGPAIVLITALEEADERVRTLGAGGLPVLFTPLDGAEFSRTVAWALHSRFVLQACLAPSHLEALYRIATSANLEPALAPSLERLLNTCVGALGADAGSVMLLATEGDHRFLKIAASIGLEPRAVPIPPPTASVAGWVAEHQRPLRLSGPVSRYPQFRQLKAAPGVSESLVVPIVFRRETMGVLSLRASRPNTLLQEHLAFAVSAADIAAAAVHRSRLEQRREHQERLAILGQLSASVAHEMRNPLAYVGSNLDTLENMLVSGKEIGKSPDEEEVKEILKDCREGVERLRQLTSNLVIGSRKPPEARDGLRPAVDVPLLLQRAHALVYPQLKHRAKVTVLAGETHPVRIDGGRILQVLLNLLVNAGQAVPDRGEIILRSLPAGDFVAIEVEDNGTGIPDHVATRLFEPFFTTKPEGEGTGLGLSISKQIAVEHGGDLTYASAPGGGACFRLLLPVGRTLPASSSEQEPPSGPDAPSS